MLSMVKEAGFVGRNQERSWPLMVWMLVLMAFNVTSIKLAVRRSMHMKKHAI